MQSVSVTLQGDKIGVKAAILQATTQICARFHRTAHVIRASLFAMATISTLRGALASSPFIQAAIAEPSA